MRVFAVVGLVALACLSCQPASSATIGQFASKEGRVVVTLTGEIVDGDAVRLASAIKTANDAGRMVSGVRLSSPGGMLVEGAKLAELIQYAKVATVVVNGTMCASACFIAFAAGSERFASYSAQIGVHGASVAGVDNANAKSATIAMAKLVKDLGVSPAIIGQMVVTPPDQMVWLTPVDLQGMGVKMTGKPAQTPRATVAQVPVASELSTPAPAPMVTPTPVTAAPVTASAQPPEDPRIAEIKAMHWADADGLKLAGSHSSILGLTGFRAVTGEEASRLREIVDVRPQKPIEAEAVDPSLQNEIVYEWMPVGYVTEADWGDINPSSMLASIQQATEQSNVVRAQRGAATLNDVRWRQIPTLNRNTHTISWSLQSSASDGTQTVNSIVMKLGRYGIERVMVIGDASGPDLAKTFQLAQDTHYFDDGARFTDYQPSTDKSAEYGVAGLVAGALGVKVAAKAVAGGALLLGIKKFAALLLLPFLWAGRKVSGLFRRSPPIPHHVEPQQARLEPPLQ